MTWDGRPPNPELDQWGWLIWQDGLPQLSRLVSVDDGVWIGCGSPENMNANGYRYIGPASPDDALEVRRLREGIEAILDMPDGGWLQALRELLKGTP